MRPETPAEIRKRLAMLDALHAAAGAPIDAPPTPEDMRRVMAEIRRRSRAY